MLKFPSRMLQAGCVSMALLGVANKPALSQTLSETPSDQPVAPPASAEVMVTAPRMEIPLRENPGATSVVGAETILKTTSKSIAAEEALWLVPGVKVDNQADGERVHLSIRGQGLLTERGVRGIKVLLDGLPLNDPTGFAPDLFDVDWAIGPPRRGAAAGPRPPCTAAAASGGVINIVTRDGGAAPGSRDVARGVGSGAFWKPFGEVGGTRGTMNYRVSASRHDGATAIACTPSSTPTTSTASSDSTVGAHDEADLRSWPARTSSTRTPRG